MSPTIRAYPIYTSCFAGDSLDVAIGSSSPLTPSARYSLQICESGTSATRGAAMPLALSDIPLVADPGRHTNERGYDWPAVSIPTDSKWASGFYYAEVRENGVSIPTSRAFFVIRIPSGSRTNRIIVLWSSATAQAYWDPNKWGARVNLYDSIHLWRSRSTTTQRPLILPNGSEIADGLGTTFGGLASPWLRMHTWLNESIHQSFRADACSSWDLHNDPTSLDGYRLLVLAGHDEYWSLEMRDTVETFVRGGGHVAVFSGNSVWWQIRYENDGQLMVCYKSVLEDPLLGPDQNRVTSNWSTQSPGRPENTLTGVGFRYGWMGNGGGDFTVLPPLPGEGPHPALAGVVDAAGNVLTPFGHELGGEADGIELDFSDPSRPKPTFRDGTPNTFHVLAYNQDGAALRGRGVMGYFTNGGSVFTAPFTAWVSQLRLGYGASKAGPIDLNVYERITTNVISWLLAQSPAPLMGPSASVRAPEKWTNAGLAPYTAMAASAQGSLFLALGNKVISRHPDLQTGANAVSVSIPGPIECMGSDLYGKNLFAAIANQLYAIDVTGSAINSVSAFAPPLDPGESFRGVTAVNHESTVYAIVGSVGDQAELCVTDGGGPWYSVGDASGLRTLTASDGYLIAASNDNRLVARIAGKLDEHTILYADETWVDIGAAPDVSALAEYYGRLYGLSGTLPGVELMSRSVRPDPECFPIDFGRLLFYKRTSGECAVGRLLGHGDYESQQSFTLDPGWTHVTLVNHRLVLFYNSGDGTAMLGHVDVDGNWNELSTISGFGKWNIVVSDGDHVVFYQTGAPYAYVGRFDPKTGEYVNTDYHADFSSTWTLAAATWGISTRRVVGRGRYFVFYAGDGTIAICEVDGNGKFHSRGFGAMMPGADSLVPAGQLGMFAYESRTGRGQFGETVMALPSRYSRIQDWSDFEQQWFVAAGRNGLVFFYRQDTGVGVVGGFSRNVTEVFKSFKELNRWDAGDFLSGWTNIIGIHSSPPINPLFLPKSSVSTKVKVHLPGT